MTLDEFLQLAGETFSLANFVGATMAGLLIGAFGYPIVMGDRKRSAYAVLWLGVPTMAVYFALATFLGWLDGDPFWPRTLGRAFGVELYLVAIAVGATVRIWLDRS